jgi:hypothetical protein
MPAKVGSFRYILYWLNSFDRGAIVPLWHAHHVRRFLGPTHETIGRMGGMP